MLPARCFGTQETRERKGRLWCSCRRTHTNAIARSGHLQRGFRAGYDFTCFKVMNPDRGGGEEPVLAEASAIVIVPFCKNKYE
jgi:hypothetical protein